MKDLATVNCNIQQTNNNNNNNNINVSFMSQLLAMEIGVMKTDKADFTNVRDLSLTLLAESDIDDLIETIQGCEEGCETVDLSCSNQHLQQPQWSDPKIYRLFQQIGSLPNLTSVSFKFLGWGDHDNMIPLSLFTTLLSSQTKTKTLVRFKMALVGPISSSPSKSKSWNDDDLQDFCNALKNQINLREFRISSCSFSHAWLRSASDKNLKTLDPMILALSELPSLEIVNIKAANKGHLGKLQPESLGTLCQSSSMKNLCLDNFILGNNHLTMVANSFDSPSSSLEDLYINLSGEYNLDPRHLPLALRTNQTLKRLQLRLAKQKTLLEFLLNMAEALKHNNSLQEFSVFGGFKVDDDIERAYLESLCNDNYALEVLVLPSNHLGNCHWRRKIDMFLLLNGRGRKRLLSQSENITIQEWIMLFSNPSNDLTFVYYYIKHICPLLCKRVLLK